MPLLVVSACAAIVAAAAAFLYSRVPRRRIEVGGGTTNNNNNNNRNGGRKKKKRVTEETPTTEEQVQLEIEIGALNNKDVPQLGRRNSSTRSLQYILQCLGVSTNTLLSSEASESMVGNDDEKSLQGGLSATDVEENDSSSTLSYEFTPTTNSRRGKRRLSLVSDPSLNNQNRQNIASSIDEATQELDSSLGKFLKAVRSIDKVIDRVDTDDETFTSRDSSCVARSPDLVKPGMAVYEEGEEDTDEESGDDKNDPASKQKCKYSSLDKIGQKCADMGFSGSSGDLQLVTTKSA